MLLIVIIIVIGMIIIGVRINELNRGSQIEELYATQGYTHLWNLLEDCTLVNKDFPIMGIQIEQEDCAERFFRYSIQFRDLGVCVISPRKYGLELAERQIKSDYQLALSKCKNGTLQTVVQREFDRANQRRVTMQQEMDSFFFNALFDGQFFNERDFVIASPFESYASSSGSYIVDTDYWKIKGDDAVYTGLIEFADSQSKIVPYAIEKTAKELFPDAKVSRYSAGCYICLPII